jgi:adenosylcobinamide-phosphate synthase
MSLEGQILIAVLVDLLLGDPRWLPHPVRLIGWLAARVELVARKLIRHERAAGIIATLVIVLATGGGAAALIHGAAWLHPWVGDAVSIALLYTCFAGRDLERHSTRVFNALRAENLIVARQQLALLVGRDTAQLDEREITRATVESVAENLADGVTAPLFFALLAGPVGALTYKAINTLDSMFGHKDARYFYFGWASARLDDLANYLPARLTAPLTALAALLLGGRARAAWRVLRRDGRKHASPNSGLTEAAFAGALGVQLGGTNFYDGEPHLAPLLGEPQEPLQAAHIFRANALMMLTAFLFLLTGLGLRWLIAW